MPPSAEARRREADRVAAAQAGEMSRVLGRAIAMYEVVDVPTAASLRMEFDEKIAAAIERAMGGDELWTRLRAVSDDDSERPVMVLASAAGQAAAIVLGFGEVVDLARRLGEAAPAGWALDVGTKDMSGAVRLIKGPGGFAVRVHGNDWSNLFG